MKYLCTFSVLFSDIGWYWTSSRQGNDHKQPVRIPAVEWPLGTQASADWKLHFRQRLKVTAHRTGALRNERDTKVRLGVWSCLMAFDATLDAFEVRYEADTLKLTPFGDIGSCLCGSHGREFCRCGSLMELVRFQRLFAKDSNNSNTSVRLSSRFVGSAPYGCAVQFHYCRSGQHQITFFRSLQIRALRTFPCINLCWKMLRG